MKRKTRRLAFVFVGLALVGIAATLVLAAFRDNLVFFYSPTDVVQRPLPADQRVRLGGLVEEGSVVRASGGTRVSFRITDLMNALPVTYDGILPDLFRDGQGVVAEGRFRGGVFAADSVLAKHDENYMPPEVAEALKKSGQWEQMEKALGESIRHKGTTP